MNLPNHKQYVRTGDTIVRINENNGHEEFVAVRLDGLGVFVHDRLLNSVGDSGRLIRELYGEDDPDIHFLSIPVSGMDHSNVIRRVKDSARISAYREITRSLHEKCPEL